MIYYPSNNYLEFQLKFCTEPEHDITSGLVCLSYFNPYFAVSKFYEKLVKRFIEYKSIKTNLEGITINNQTDNKAHDWSNSLSCSVLYIRKVECPITCLEMHHFSCQLRAKKKFPFHIIITRILRNISYPVSNWLFQIKTDAKKLKLNHLPCKKIHQVSIAT